MCEAMAKTQLPQRMRLRSALHYRIPEFSNSWHTGIALNSRLQAVAANASDAAKSDVHDWDVYKHVAIQRLCPSSGNSQSVESFDWAFRREPAALVSYNRLHYTFDRRQTSFRPYVAVNCTKSNHPSLPSSMRYNSSQANDNMLTTYASRGRKVVLKVTTRLREAVERFVNKTQLLAWAFVQNPLIVKEWYRDIKDALKHFVKWIATGFRLFGTDVRASYYLLKRVIKGYPLSVRERRLLVRTTSDCLKLIPFSFFIIVPFAELALPFFLRLFPNMLPSSFFEQKYDNATLARRFKAKQEMADFWQQVVEQRTKEIYQNDQHEYADKAAELRQFQEKLIEGIEFPSLKEILRFSSLFQHEMNLKHMSTQQISAMSKMLGLPTSRTWWPGHLEVQLRHYLTNLRREDRDLHWEGIDGLKGGELIEACRKRAIRFHGVTEDQMRQDLKRWLELSANHKNIPTALLLWIQSFYLRDPAREHETSQLPIKVKQQEPEQEDASKAFHGMADRQKDAVERVQSKLDELKIEISQVIEQQQRQNEQSLEPIPEHNPDPAAAKQDPTEMGIAAKASESKELFEHQQRLGHESPEAFAAVMQNNKRFLLRHIKKTDTELKLYKEIVNRQKSLLDLQLRFMLNMRDNKPTCQKDADVILLDQRVRLLEMINSFESSAEDIQKLSDNHGNDEDEMSEDDDENQKVNLKRWLNEVTERIDRRENSFDDLDAASALEIGTTEERKA